MARDGIVVQVPDLFQGFLEDEPIINEHYKSVRAESEQDVGRKCNLDLGMRKKIEKCDFAYFGAVMAPKANRERFRVICDWGNWIFPYDDLFDNGELRDDPAHAKKTMSRLLASFEKPSIDFLGENSMWLSLVTFHDRIWSAISEDSTEAVSHRYAEAMTDYCTGTLDQVRQYGSMPKIENMLTMRRRSVCVRTLYALIEFGHEIRIPAHIRNDPGIQEIEMIGIDITMMHNDILSYQKEESEGVPHNLIAVCRMHGMSAQEAVNCLGAHIDQRHRRLDHAISSLPSWGKEIDAEVCRFAQAVRDTIKANLYWSFKSGRFLNEENIMRLRVFGELDVLASPKFLQNMGCDDDENEKSNSASQPGEPMDRFVAPMVIIRFLVTMLTSAYKAFRVASGLLWNLGSVCI